LWWFDILKVQPTSEGERTQNYAKEILPRRANGALLKSADLGLL
jgi:hypothetical protein